MITVLDFHAFYPHRHAMPPFSSYALSLFTSYPVLLENHAIHFNPLLVFYSLGNIIFIQELSNRKGSLSLLCRTGILKSKYYTLYVER